MLPDLQSQIDNYAAYLSGIFQANADSFIEGISDDFPAKHMDI
ncbi:hypothetical protein [Fulvivirga maritima]|nr:hypothetical protein [Fulvivirga maritima]